MACRVAAIVPWLVMKGMALADRLKEKDAYDVYCCVNVYQVAQAASPRSSGRTSGTRSCARAWGRSARPS